MVTRFDLQVDNALAQLAGSVRIHGPIHTDNHVTYVVRGLADTNNQMRNLCWCILGSIAEAIRMDFTIDSAIGEGETARENLHQALIKRLSAGKKVTEKQKSSNRDPLLQELISHLLLAIHRRKSILPEWLAEVQSCRSLHLSANDSGLDLIAIGVENNRPFTVVGEVKAYEKDPWAGLNDACEKFSQVRRGEYNDEIRPAMRKLSSVVPFTKEELAANIWIDEGRFGAVVGHDIDHSCDIHETCTHSEVVEQDSRRLFFITSPYTSMRELFDKIVEKLCRLAESLGDPNV